jgi:hypothetical protein
MAIKDGGPAGRQDSRQAAPCLGMPAPGNPAQADACSFFAATDCGSGFLIVLPVPIDLLDDQSASSL